MAEFNYFCTKNELIELLQMAVVTDYQILIKKHFASPHIERCESMDEIRLTVEKGQYSFLLAYTDFTRYATKPILYDRDGRQFWYLRPSLGGPFIEIVFFAPFEKHDQRIVPCSLFAFDSKIMSPNNRTIEPAGEEVKVAFKRLTSTLSKRARRVKSKTRSAYVSPGVEDMLASGWLLGAPFENS